MAEWLFSPVVDKLINFCFENLQNKFSGQTPMKKALERLRENHPKIQAFVYAVRRAQIIDQDAALNQWIWKLRDAIDETDDLLDDFEYFKHEEQLTRNKENKNERSYLINMYNTAKRLCIGNKDPLRSKPNWKGLEEVVQKLDIILAEASPFLHLLENIKQEQREQLVELHKTRETGSLPKNDLIDRGENKEFVIRWLRQASDVTTTALHRNISLLSIVGHGGMGKTTLLQHVYGDDMTKEFDLKMWVCVSDSFDVKKVIADMLESLENKRHSLDSLHALQESLKFKVMSKKFLLVMDDLWDNEEEALLCSKWENVLAPLANGGLGSKILITTRMESVASMIAKVISKRKEALMLEGLKEEECLQLLISHAFDDAENPDDHKKLTSIAVELVKKLYRSPLAAKVIGGVLNSSLDESHWRNVLNKSFALNGIFPILKLSYIFLPEHLQRCFSFCSIFEQDHVFDKDGLVRMWIALGFIQSSHIQGDTLTLEDIGERYFDVLINKSFFDKVFYESGYPKTYKMHDLLHELAQSASKSECFRFVGDQKSLLLEIPETIRHLSITSINSEVLKVVGRFKNLRTLLITITCYDQRFVDALDEMLKVTRSVRLFHINYDSLEVIPENFGYLHHLRYWSFHTRCFMLLPRSLSRLYHLQFIIFDIQFGEYFSNNDYFPRDMNNLSNLRYWSYLQLNFPGIGKLKFLKELNDFRIKNEIGYRIEELEHMNDLHILEINDLQNVRDADEASHAKLCDKRKLTDLSLEWNHKEGEIADPGLDERVLDNLQPHNYLKTLTIQSYIGARSAKWMNEANLIKNLEDIQLSSCLEWEILPPFGQLPFLKKLCLGVMPKLKRLENKFHWNDMYCIFPSLEELHINSTEALVDWFDVNVVDGLFPCLTTLVLDNCPNLQELPYLPPKIKTLAIENIGWKTLKACSISASIPLETLDVRCCPNITSISMVGIIGKLKKLVIIDCPNIISLGDEHQEVDAIHKWQLILNDLIITDPSLLQMEPLRSSTSIRNLTIMNNDELVSFPLEFEQWLLQVSSSLRKLEFRGLPSLQFLPSSVTSIPSLETLYISSLPRLRELPNLPPSKKFSITGCDSELMKHHKDFPCKL